MQKKSKTVEAVLFFNEQGVCQQMLFAEFEAVLDRVVDLPGYAGQRACAAFVLVEPSLAPRAVVFFHLEFDALGGADPTWNIPLRQLAEGGDLSTDLGDGPVRLACASHCADASVREQLWEPSRGAERDDLLLIRDALLRNPFGMLINYDTMQAGPHPLATQPVPIASSVQRWYKPGPFAAAPMAPVPVLEDWAAPRNSQADDEHNMEQRLKAARLIKQQRSLLNDLNRQCDTLKADHEQQLLKQQATATRQQNRLRKQYDKLLAEQNRRLDALERDQAAQLQGLTQQNEQQQKASEVQLGQCQRELRLQVDINNRLLSQLAQQAGALQKLQKQLLDREGQVAELQGKLAAQTSSDPFGGLAALGVVFVAFHPGAGHLTIPASDLLRYQENPMAYVATKCSVSPERYRQWLRHYQSPRCEGTGGDGKPCNHSISRVDHPSRFHVGESNCCAVHKAALPSPA